MTPTYKLFRVLFPTCLYHDQEIATWRNFHMMLCDECAEKLRGRGHEPEELEYAASVRELK